MSTPPFINLIKVPDVVEKKSHQKILKNKKVMMIFKKCDFFDFPPKVSTPGETTLKQFQHDSDSLKGLYRYPILSFRVVGALMR